MAVLAALPAIAADAIDGTENPYKQSRRGYRIFVDGGTYLNLVSEVEIPENDWLGGLLDSMDSKSSLVEVRFSNGYQFNNYFYLGGGVGVNCFPDDKLWAMPIFAHVRGNFLNGRISPFLDVKAGTNITSASVGAYVGISAGVRIGMTRTTAINIGIELKDSYADTPSRCLGHANMGLTVGYEF